MTYEFLATGSLKCRLYILIRYEVLEDDYIVKMRSSALDI